MAMKWRARFLFIERFARTRQSWRAIPASRSTFASGQKTMSLNISKAAAQAACRCFSFVATSFSIGPEFTANMAKPYEDNAARFIFLSKAAVELARRLTPAPQILHAHDWAPALVPVLVKEQQLPFATVLTIHHLAEQGSFWGLDFSLTNLPERYFSLRGVEFFGRLNLLKGGILFADRITTVSEHYLREMMKPEFACGLEHVLRENAHKIVAILNGADYERWNPATDHLLPARFDVGALDGKQACRNELLQMLDLAPSPEGLICGMVTRLVAEKGFDALMPVLDRLLSDDMRLIILGEGDPGFEIALAVAARKYPTKFAYRKSYDEKLAHLIEAGSDVTLIPSRFEPSGTSAMYSLRYGALPIARATGGIQEIIEDYDPWSDSGYGFLYYDGSSEALWDAIKRAREVFDDPVIWTKLMERAMQQNFSWQRAADRYEQIYGGLTVQLPCRRCAPRRPKLSSRRSNW